MSRSSLPIFILALAAAAPAHTQVARVFVSVNGNDANTCSNVATPCRTLGGGIGQVDAQGEVIVMDTGSYAGTTITKSVRINAAVGVVAFSGLPIVADPGAGGAVVLRGLTLKAATPGMGVGITHQSGTLFVENAVVDGWSQGLSSATTGQRLLIKASVFRNNASAGVYVVPGATEAVAIDDSFFEKNTVGVWFEGGKGRVSNSVMTGNVWGSISSFVGTEATFQRCEASDNANAGLQAQLGGLVRASASTLTRNGTGLSNVTGSTAESFNNNVIRGNVNNETFGTITGVTLQ
jgi:hypothetical protein